MFGGLALLALSFAMLGPMYLRGGGGSTAIINLRGAFDNLPSAIGASLLQGVGWACTVIPTLPVLLGSVPAGDAPAKARMTGLWVAAYSAGSAAGPLLGAAMLRTESAALCNAEARASTGGCFDGCCTIACVALLAAAVVLWLVQHRARQRT